MTRPSWPGIDGSGYGTPPVYPGGVGRQDLCSADAGGLAMPTDTWAFDFATGWTQVATVGPPNRSNGAMAYVAANGAALPLDLSGAGLPGCQLWVDPQSVLGIFRGGNQAQFSLGIPSNAALSGLAFGTQALSLDQQAPSGLVALSNAGIGVMR